VASQAKDTFAWYSYSVWASTERQRWIIYATFGHTAAELSNPVSPAEDERDNLLNVEPHAQFLGNGVYEFLPALSRGNGVPTPTLRAEYTTVEINYGMAKRLRRRSPPSNQTAGRDALVSTGRGRKYTALRLPASTHEPGGHSR